MKTTNNIIIALMTFTLCSCCNYIDKECHYVLRFDPKLSNVTEKSFPRDSIVVKSFLKDSMVIIVYSNGSPWESIYLPIGDDIYEKRYKYNDALMYCGIDTILTFSNKSTSFFYKSVYTFMPTVQSFTEGSCKYKIEKIGDDFITIKQSAIDTTYKEIFYYDKDYRISRYINIWQDNICVYVEKK